MVKPLYILMFCLSLMCGCSDERIVGTWVQPIPGQEDSLQGFTLNKDGTAASVNMYTLQYTGWQKNGKTLTLKGESIGNGQTIQVNEEFAIKDINSTSLILQRGSKTFSYTRK